MTGSSRVLLLTNGHGEDVMAADLGRNLRERSGLEVVAFPLVGEGKAYGAADISVTGRRVMLPSGGLVRAGWRQWWGDMRAGLPAATAVQWAALARLRGTVDRVVVLGDVYPMVLAAWSLRRPVVFLPTAKSAYISGHSAIETWFMRRHCPLVLPRDAPTARALSSQGVPALYVGNLMMDSVGGGTVELGLDPSARLVGILPGSRRDAYENLQVILPAVASIYAAGEGRWEFAVALAPSLSLDRVVQAAKAVGWEWQPVPAPGHVAGYLVRAGCRVRLLREAFGDVIQAAHICIGLAGTANEQAVGVGCPVVAFPRPGGQFGPKFVRAQQRLLGEALAVVAPDPQAVAAEVLAIGRDPARWEAMARCGRERMGSPGATARAAAAIIALWEGTDPGGA